MELGLFFTLFLMNVATVAVVGFLFYRYLIKRIRTLMEKERKKYFEIVQDSIYVAMENERKVKQQIVAFDNAVKTSDERLKSFGNLREAAETVRSRQAELEERLASLLIRINEQAGRIDGLDHRIPGMPSPSVSSGRQSSIGHSAHEFPYMQNHAAGHQAMEGLGRITGTLGIAGVGNDFDEVDLQTGFKSLREGFLGDINRSIRESTGDIPGILDEVDQILDDDDEDLVDEIDLDAVIKRINDRVGSHPDFELKKMIGESATEARAENEKRCKKIVELAARGISPGNIARKLDIPLGEVQIILRLKRHLPAGENSSSRGEV